MASLVEYNFLIERWQWSFEDLGDLLVEVRCDADLADGERRELLAEIYRLIWERAQPELGRRRKVSSAAWKEPL